MRASARLFDKAIGKIDKQDVQVIHAQFLSLQALETAGRDVWQGLGSAFVSLKTG